ncbi:hypothetical protein CEP53_013350 [Fusarium sp. AF-6]|nr:hypothetical protein CEP53_013350 [Fusarium sp. AF-6]
MRRWCWCRSVPAGSLTFKPSPSSDCSGSGSGSSFHAPSTTSRPDLVRPRSATSEINLLMSRRIPTSSDPASSLA